MGFVKGRASEGLWMTLNGGAMQMSGSKAETEVDPEFKDIAIKSGGYGIIDVAWKVKFHADGAFHNCSHWQSFTH